MQNYQVLETLSSSRSNASPCSDSSSPVISKTNGKNVSTNKQQQIPNVTSKTQSLGASESDRPPHSYIALISMAILSKIDRKILLNEIYDWVIQNFPYYQSRTDKSWRNSIRHNLSLNECFIKVGKAGNGRGYYWSIHSANLNDFKKGDFRRRQARLRAKHDKNHAVPTSKFPKETKEKTTNQQNQNTQNFQSNFYPASSSYSNSDFSNFYGHNNYQACAYTNTSSYENNDYIYSFNNEQNINESNFLSPNISSSSVSSKESSSSNGLISKPTNPTPLTPLTPITTNNKSSSSSSTSSSLSSSPLSSTNVSSSCFYNQNYNHFSSNAWFQQPVLDQFQTNNTYSYSTNANNPNLYQSQAYYGYNTQTPLNQSNNSVLMPLNTNESNAAEAQQTNMDNLIYCTASNQANDYAQYTNRPNFSFL